MPHHVDIDGIHERLFILHCLCFASEPYCRAYHVGYQAEDSADFGWSYYLGWTKSLLCENLIQCAIKMRILQDLLEKHEVGLDFDRIERDSLRGLSIGRFDIGNESLTLRNACNKIIHATDVSLVWAGLDERDRTEHWTGWVALDGTRGNAEWRLLLNVVSLATALHRVLSSIEEQVDFYHLYKYST